MKSWKPNPSRNQKAILFLLLDTFEKSATYHRMKADGRFLVYLSGYHNTAKTRFLTKLTEGNSIADWQHFGDIDPNGFAILQNLIRKTGLPFQPVHMSIAELLENRNCWRPLTVHDRKKAEQFVKDGIYLEIMQFCLEHNCKLEQEIVGMYDQDVREKETILF